MEKEIINDENVTSLRDEFRKYVVANYCEKDKLGSYWSLELFNRFSKDRNIPVEDMMNMIMMLCEESKMRKNATVEDE